MQYKVIKCKSDQYKGKHNNIEKDYQIMSAISNHIYVCLYFCWQMLSAHYGLRFSGEQNGQGLCYCETMKKQTMRYYTT